MIVGVALYAIASKDSEDSEEEKERAEDTAKAQDKGKPHQFCGLMSTARRGGD